MEWAAHHHDQTGACVLRQRRLYAANCTLSVCWGTLTCLDALLSAAGLKEDAFGRKRTAYSFRHTYASNQIRKGTDIYTLAINMRTSVRMIEMYYSDVVPDEMAKQLEGGSD